MPNTTTTTGVTTLKNLNKKCLIMTFCEVGWNPLTQEVGETNYAKRTVIPFATVKEIKERKNWVGKFYTYDNLPYGTLVETKDFEVRSMTPKEVEYYELVKEVA